MINRPALKYNGGKFLIRKWILDNLPEHKSYIETCFGAGSVLLSKKRSSMEFANDIDGNVHNFFTVLRDNPKELIRMITYTEYSDRFLQKSLKMIQSETDPIKQAYYFYCISWMSMRANDTRSSNLNFRMKGNISKSGGHNPANLFAQTKHLYQIAKRLRGVIITNLDINDTLYLDSKDSLFYVDMPYLHSSRNSKNMYNHEFGKKTEHSTVLYNLTNISGMAVVSHYESDLYDSILHSWEKIKITTSSNTFTANNKNRKRTEFLYINPAAIKRNYPLLFNKESI